jgi:hypothetical protein
MSALFSALFCDAFGDPRPDNGIPVLLMDVGARYVFYKVLQSIEFRSLT